MMRRRRPRRAIRDWALAAGGLAALGMAAWIAACWPAPAHARLRMTAGSALGVRHQIGATLAEEARRRGVVLTLEETTGSEEALDRLEAGTLDVALVQGGLDPGRRASVRQVVALHVEPLHLLVRRELAPEVEQSLLALRGREVNLGAPGSGTQALARAVLEFAGLRPRDEAGRGDYVARTLSYRDLGRPADGARLPDAIFMVSSLPSPVARHLVGARAYRLVPLPFGEAFALDALGRGRAPAPDAEAIDPMHVSTTVVPAFTYGVDPGVPPRPLETLGTRLLLVARAGADPEAIGRLLEVAFGSRFAQVAKPPLDARLLELPPEMPRHEGAVRYLARNKPLIAGDVIDTLEKGTSLVGALLGAAFFLGQWLLRRLRLRRNAGFEHYIRRVTEVERQAQELELAEALDLRGLLRLQRALGQLKAEALARFADGQIGGEELMSSFLAHVNDARGYLTHLILHERDNLEEAAQLRGRSARDLWREALDGPPGAPEDLDLRGPVGASSR